MGCGWCGVGWCGVVWWCGVLLMSMGLASDGTSAAEFAQLPSNAVLQLTALYNCLRGVHSASLAST